METRSVTDSLNTTQANSIAFTGAVRESLGTLVSIAREAHSMPTYQASQTVALLNNAVEPYRQLIRALDANVDYCPPAQQVSVVLANIRGTLLSDDHIDPAYQLRIQRSAQTLHQCMGNYGVFLRTHVEESKGQLIELKKHISTIQREVYTATS